MLISLSLLLACGQEPAPPPAAPPPRPEKVEVRDTAPPAAPSQAPRIKAIRFEPKTPTASDDLLVKVDAVDPDSPDLDVDLQWAVNGKVLLHRTAETLPASEFVKGDEITVVVTVSDGEHTVKQDSGMVKVANAPPFFLSDPRGLDRVDGYTVKAKDPDDDPISYTLSGEPKGMTIDANSGTLHYTGAEDEPGGDYSVKVIAEDPDGANVRWEFGIAVTPGSKARKK